VAVRDLVVAVLNAFVTAVTAAVNVATGGKARFDRHLTVVCEGGWLSDRGLSNVYTTGNTINVKSGYEEQFRAKPALLEHEWRHSVQWAVFGPVRFLPLYALSYFGSQRLAGCQCWNVFEWTADFADGGYDCPGFGKRASVATSHGAGAEVES
jgi:hypothetical protein